MKKPTDWEKITPAGAYIPLPANAYVCKIMAAKCVTTKSGSEMLEVSIDILEGEYKDYFANDYRNNANENKRWKGVLRLFVPMDDGSDRDAKTKRSFKAFTNHVEEANNGYKWEWDESTLKGKTVGVMFRNEEWYNADKGQSFWQAKPCWTISVEDVRSGKFTVPADRYDQNKPAVTTYTEEATAPIADTDDLPF